MDYYTIEMINKMIRHLKINRIAEIQYYDCGVGGEQWINDNKDFNEFYDYISGSHINLFQIISAYKSSTSLHKDLLKNKEVEQCQ